MNNEYTYDYWYYNKTTFNKHNIGDDYFTPYALNHIRSICSETCDTLIILLIKDNVIINKVIFDNNKNE